MLSLTLKKLAPVISSYAWLNASIAWSLPSEITYMMHYVSSHAPEWEKKHKSEWQESVNDIHREYRNLLRTLTMYSKTICYLQNVLEVFTRLKDAVFKEVYSTANCFLSCIRPNHVMHYLSIQYRHTRGLKELVSQ